MPSPTDRLNAALTDRYRVDCELGSGGMATVYLAHDLKHDREVEIKVLHPDPGATLGGERFLSEIKTTAKLQHPHILPLLDSGDADGLRYYVMPYVTGETLRAWPERERQLPMDDALRIARRIPARAQPAGVRCGAGGPALPDDLGSAGAANSHGHSGRPLVSRTPREVQTVSGAAWRVYR